MFDYFERCVQFDRVLRLPVTAARGKSCELTEGWGGSAGVRLGFRFLGAMLVGDIPISFIQGREDAEKTTGTVSQCYLSHRDAG